MISLIALLLAGSAPPSFNAAEAAALLASQPSGGPGPDEIAITAISDPVVQSCIASSRKVAEQVQSDILRVAMTESPKLGQIWRADVATRERRAIITRFICYKSGGVSRGVMRPLEMFDPRQSLAPLPQ